MGGPRRVPRVCLEFTLARGTVSRDLLHFPQRLQAFQNFRKRTILVNEFRGCMDSPLRFQMWIGLIGLGIRGLIAHHRKSRPLQQSLTFFELGLIFRKKDIPWIRRVHMGEDQGATIF